MGRGIQCLTLAGALWLAPAWAAPPGAEPPADAEGVSGLAEQAQTRHRVDPAVDTQAEEAPESKEEAEEALEEEAEEATEAEAGEAEEPLQQSLGPGPSALPSAPPLGPLLEREEVASYFAQGVLAEARAACRSARWARQGLRLLEGEPPTRPVHYLRAQCLLRLGQSPQAAQALAALVEQWPELGDYLRLESARAWERARRWEEAAQQYEAIAAGSRPWAQARLRLAAVRERRKDWSGAVAALAPLVQAQGVGDSLQAEAWLGLARLARLQGDHNGEHRALLAVWALHPHSRQAPQAWARLRRLPLPVRWKVARAETLLSLHHNAEALRLLGPLLAGLELPEPLACRAHFAHGMALRKERQHTRAVQALRPVVEQCLDEELRPRALAVLGYSESLLEPQAAVATWLRLVEGYPEHPEAPWALVSTARELLELGEVPRALELLERVAVRYPQSPLATEALFERFWLHRARGELGPALEALERAERLAGGALEPLLRARYWRARVLGAQGRGEESLALLEQVAREGAATWYGLVARSRLAQQAPERARQVEAWLQAQPEPPVPWPLPLGALAEEPRFRLGLELVRLGHREGPAVLLALSHQVQGEPLWGLFHVLRESGHELYAQVVARALVRAGQVGPWGAGSKEVYAAAYPQAFRRWVERYGRAARVEPDLVQALLREESNFNPRARSTAGALGLAQLMPATAQEVAQQLRSGPITTASLLEPRQSIRLGSAYLGGLRRRFGGSVAHAVAGYNAGPGAVGRWLARWPQAELDEWVEHIPVEETRHYVKRVLGGASAYALLYGRGPLAALPLGAEASLATGSR